MTPNQPPLNIERLRETRNNFIKEVVALNESEAIQKISTNPIYPNMVSESMTSLELTEEEKEIAKQIIEIHRVPQTPQIMARDYLLLSTLLPTYMIPILPDLEYVPDNLIVQTLETLLQPMSVFMTTSDMEQKAWQILLSHNYVAKRIKLDPHSEFTSTCADLILKAKDTYVCLNLEGYDLSDFSKDRAEIFKFILEKHNLVSDVTPTGENPMVGILISHVGGDDSTLYVIQLLKDLRSKQIPSLLICDSTASISTQKKIEELATKTLLLPKGIKEAIQLVQKQNLEFIVLTDPLHDAEHPAFLLATQKLAKHHIALQNTLISTGFDTTNHILIDSSLPHAGNVHTGFTEILHPASNLSRALTISIPEDEDLASLNRESIGISEETVLYVSAAPLHFMTPSVRSCWIYILSKKPNSKLLLLPFHDDNISQKDRELFKIYFENEAQNQSVDKSNILILTDTIPNIQVLDSYLALSNCYLDTFPCNSQLPAGRSLAQNLSVITQSGKLLRECTTSTFRDSHKEKVHVAQSEEQYIESAIKIEIEPILHLNLEEPSTTFVDIFKNIKQ